MNAEAHAERLARTWIQGWIDGDPYELPLAETFTHSSPFGTIEGRATYLEFMQPMIGKSPPIEIAGVLGDDEQAFVRYDMTTPSGLLPCCDWVRVEGSEIVAITSYYDASQLRP